MKSEHAEDHHHVKSTAVEMHSEDLEVNECTANASTSHYIDTQP